MAHLAAPHLFPLHPYPDLHGRAVGHVQTSLQGQQIADMDRTVKINPVNGGGNHVGSGKAGGNDKGGIINKLHDYPAVYIAGRVGMIGHHHMRNYGSTETGGVLTALVHGVSPQQIDKIEG